MTPQQIVDYWPQISQSFHNEGVTISLQQGLAVLQDLQVVFSHPPISVVNEDEIDIRSIQIISGSPDVRNWPVTTKITSVEFSTAGCKIDFDAKDRWPSVKPPGWQGDLQYTLWVLYYINSVWYAVGCIEYWKGLDFNGGDLTHASNQMMMNWFYYAPPMADWKLGKGEMIGLMVTAGDARRKDIHSVEERSNIVKIPLFNAPHIWTF